MSATIRTPTIVNALIHLLDEYRVYQRLFHKFIVSWFINKAATCAIWFVLLGAAAGGAGTGAGAGAGAAWFVISEASELSCGFICNKDANAAGCREVNAASGLFKFRLGGKRLAAVGVLLWLRALLLWWLVDLDADDLALAKGDGLTLGQGLACE